MRDVLEAGISFFGLALQAREHLRTLQDHGYLKPLGLAGTSMSIRVPLTFATLGILLSSLLPPVTQAQVRVETPEGAGISGIGGVGAGAGAAVTNPAPLNLNSTLPPASSAPAANVSGTAAAPSAATGETDTQGASSIHSPLLLAHSSIGNGGSKCDIIDAARQTCSGEDCLLSCPSDVCPGQQVDKCEFVIDCVTEIAANVVSDDQQCDEQYIERSTFQNDGKTPVTVIRIPVGQECKPPPCIK